MDFRVKYGGADGTCQLTVRCMLGMCCGSLESADELLFAREYCGCFGADVLTLLGNIANEVRILRESNFTVIFEARRASSGPARSWLNDDARDGTDYEAQAADRLPLGSLRERLCQTNSWIRSRMVCRQMGQVLSAALQSMQEAWPHWNTSLMWLSMQMGHVMRSSICL